MNTSKWQCIISFILCFLLVFTPHIYAMNVSIELLRELAPLIARATASVCMYAAASKKVSSYFHEYVNHHTQLCQVVAHPEAWSNIELLQQINTQLLQDYCNSSYALLNPPHLPPSYSIIAPISPVPESNEHNEHSILLSSSLPSYTPPALGLSFNQPQFPQSNHQMEFQYAVHILSGIERLQKAEAEYTLLSAMLLIILPALKPVCAVPISTSLTFSLVIMHG